jgi:hypothetical protein
MTSGLPRRTDILSVPRQVSKVPTADILTTASVALATCELKFNFNFYRSTCVSETALHFFANAIADRVRERQIGLPRRRTAALEGPKISIKRRQSEPMRLPHYFDILEASGLEQLSQTGWVA